MMDQLQAAVRLREQGQVEEANALLVQLADLYPEHAEVNYQCAWSFDVLELERDAVPYYEKAIAGNLNAEDRQGAYLGLGSTYRTLGQYVDSQRIFERAMREFPENRAFEVFYAMTLYNQGKHENAMELLLRNLAYTSNDSEISQYKKAILFYSDKLTQKWS